MASSRRVFLEVLGGASAVAAGCGGVVDGDATSTGGDALAGSRGSAVGSGGTGGGSGGSGGSTGGSGGSAGTGDTTAGSGGTAGEGGSAGAPTQTGGSGGASDSGGTPDAGSRGGAGGNGGRPEGGVARPDAGRTVVEAGPAMLQPGDLAAGNVSALAVQALRVVGQNVGIGRDANGVYALTLVCTHQGCGVTPSPTNNPTQLVCPCHGSRFDRNGAVTNGPATRPLAHFAVDIDAGGNIVIHTRMTVAATTRTAVV
jgi:Rieske Fe-S protein